MKSNKCLGRNNPNCKVKDLNDRFMENIDTELKAYLLGWIISDGNVTKSSINIEIHERDKDVLVAMARDICSDITVKELPNRKRVKLSIYSMQMVDDVCRHIQVQPGKKSGIVKFPSIPPHLVMSCIRGIFDGDGSLTNPLLNKKSYLTVKISNNSSDLLQSIVSAIDIPCHIGQSHIEWSSNNALDVLNRIYSGANYYLDRKYELYCQWCHYVPGINGTSKKISRMRCMKTIPGAVLPSKNRATDAGYDLTIIKKIKQVGDVEFYTTGIKIQMDFGWMGMIYPRSSISKTGYMLANGVGVVDRTYLGEIIVALRKVNDDSPELQLPVRIAQIVPYPIIHFDIVEVDSFDNTSRGDKGFGSSGR